MITREHECAIESKVTALRILGRVHDGERFMADLCNGCHFNGNMDNMQLRPLLAAAGDVNVVVHAVVVVIEGAAVWRVRHNKVHSPGIIRYLQHQRSHYCWSLLSLLLGNVNSWAFVGQRKAHLCLALSDAFGSANRRWKI